jgi:CxxC-x17-CxxC domain-containing protein
MKNFNQQREGRFGGGFEKRKDPSMHKATCSNCGKPCEVPFRPVNGKPVYCKDCFSKMGGNPAHGNDRSPKREFRKFDDRNPRFESRNASFERKPESNDDLKRQLELVNTKLDKILAVAENFFKQQSKPVTPVAVTQEIIPEETDSLKKLVTKATSKKSSKSKK